MPELQRLWRFADERGFDWFSVSDHFQESPPQGGELDCFEAITVLSAAAMETRRVRLGSMVYCVAYRNPGLLAKSLTTIDHLSSGRVDCGLGAGWHEIEARAYGYDFPRIGVRQAAGRVRAGAAAALRPRPTALHVRRQALCPP